MTESWSGVQALFPPVIMALSRSSRVAGGGGVWEEV